MGESRTGKTIACNSYRLRDKPKQEVGQVPQDGWCHRCFTPFAEMSQS